MSNPNNKITCPNCQHQFDAEAAILQQAEAQMQQKFDAQMAQINAQNKLAQDKLKANEAALQQQKADFEAKKAKENELFQQRLQNKLKEELNKEKQQIAQSVAAEHAEEMKMLKEENEKRAEESKAYKKRELEMLKKERSLQEQQEQFKLDVEREMLEKRNEIAAEVAKREREKNELANKELQEQLNNQKKLIDEMKRKAEQGSMQLQGEVQELAIEEYLAQNFPLDTITEIKKGARGGDCIQIVHSRSKQNCGTIYYESKRTKDFSPSWIEKFKTDIREKGADIGVLVTNAMPKDMDRMGLKDGIWICNYQEFKGLSVVLRDSIIRMSNAIVAQENKGDKMSLLYDFLTSNEFKMQIEAIVEGFSQMKEDLEKEKRAMMNIWKKREKQIEKVVLNTTGMYGSIKGIAGNAVQTVNALELGDDDSIEDQLF